MSTDAVDGKRSLVVYLVCLPLAIFLGYLLVNIATDPYGNIVSTGLVGVLLMLLVSPLLIRWYHPWLITVWNSTLLFMFLPGRLPGWAVMAMMGFWIAIGHYILKRDRRFQSAPSVTRSLIFIAVVVGMTAKMRGGIGLHVFGDEAIGGKRYILIWVAIMGYFAITSQAIPANKRKLMTALFVLGGATAIIGDVAGMIGGPLIGLSVFFPLTDSTNFASQSIGAESVERFGGVANGCLAIALTLVAYYGIEGVLSLKKIWRPALFFGALFLTMLGGFRGLVIVSVMTLALVFYYEGLFQSRFMPAMVLGCLLLCGIILAFSEHMPLSVQRSIAFLPVKLDTVAKESAEATTEWRLEMWKSVVPQIPHYFFLGKGLGIDLNNLVSYYQFGESQVGGEVGGGLAAAGDYHSGPLSLIITFGIWGVIGFFWFLTASIKALWANYKYGDPDSKRLNTFLLAYFIAKTIMFFFIFGNFYSDIMSFAGIIGVSVSLNGGVARPAPVPRPKIVFNRFRPLPMPAAAS
jgi:hypothetical protein